MKPRVLSLFDGSGCWQLAAEIVGFEAKYASEIEKFPIEVTKKNFPGMIHLGDVTKLKGDEIEPCEIITAGSPCQDLSIAGARAGLKGERSGLFMEVIRIIKEMRSKTNGEYPKLVFWENVPGAFSSNGGEDFRAVIEEFVHICSDADIPRPDGGKWTPSGIVAGNGFSLAWRTLDAQYWGVPQRRRRIFLVLDLTDERAGEILFKRKGLSRNFKQECEKRKGIAACSEEGIGDAILYETNPTDARYKTTEVCQTLKERMGTGGGNVPLVGFRKQAHPQNKTDGQGWEETNIADTLNVSDNTEARTPTLCERERESTYWFDPGAHRYAGVNLENVANAVTNGTCPGWHSAVAYCNDKAETLDASYYKGSGGRGNKEREFVVQPYQKVTGSLMANSHPGSYTGQDAYNDMLVVERERERVTMRRTAIDEYKMDNKASAIRRRDYIDHSDLIVEKNIGH